MKISIKNFKIIAAVIALLFIGIDQLIKLIVVNNMSLGDSIPILNNVLHITYVLNDGAAFSFMAGQVWLLCGVTSLIMGVLIYLYISKKVTHKLVISSLALIVSGGIGNLIDRFFNGDVLFQGKVVDYVDFRIINFAVFNFADCCVVIGTILLVVYLIFYDIEKPAKIEENADE